MMDAHIERYGRLWTLVTPVLITVAAIALIELSSGSTLAIPTPGAMLLVTIAYAASVGGLLTGLISATLMGIYLLHFYATPGQPLQYTDENFDRLVGVVVAAFTISLLTGFMKQHNERLRKQNQFLLDSAGEGIYGLDRHGNSTFANPAAARMVGWEPRKLIGRPLHQLLHHTRPDGSPYPVEESPITRTLKDGATYHSNDEVFWRHDGTSFPVEYTSTPIFQAGVIGGAVVVFQDITERKRAEEALRQSEERFRLLVEGVRDYAIYMLDLDGRVMSWNGGVERIKGYRADEIIGQHFSRFFVPDDIRSGKPERELQQARDKGRYEEEGWRVRKDGTRFWAHVVLSALHDQSGRLRGFAKMTRDITERKQAEQAQRRNAELEEQNRRIAAANQMKSEFLANMSHELRTPLNSIIGFAELMHDAKVGPVSDEHKEYLGDILTSARHLLRLINDILDLARVEAGKLEFWPQPLDPAQAINEVRDILRTLAARKRIRVDVAVDPALGTLVLDPGRFKQVLYNYLSNALKFTPDEGRVMVRAMPNGPSAFRLEVEDTGVGIKPTEIGRLFSEFEQLDAGTAKRHQGAGLGLALTKRLVEAQAGQVGVRSTVGQGSTFFAILPRVAEELHVEREERPADTQLPGAPTILVVEDDSKERAWLRRTLAEAGYHVAIAASGAEALAQARSRAFDAITLDLLLPDMAGWDVLRAIRATELNRDVPAIVVTVVAEREIAAGFTIHDFLVKPPQVGELLVSLERAGVPARRGTRILVVDDDPQSLELIESALRRLGLRTVCALDGESALRIAREALPDAIVLDLMMPGMDGFEFLKRFHEIDHDHRTPVIIWTSKDLTAEDRARLNTSSGTVVMKLPGRDGALLEELQRYLPMHPTRAEHHVAERKGN
jgi:PAS domain S-box-containing protein